MASVCSAPSNIALLIQPSQTTVQSKGSYSKRLYTFIHYEHSSHPRRFILGFFLIILLTFSFAWLIAGLLRLRQTASYYESCANRKIRCASGTNLTCSLVSSLCLCPDGTFWNENKRLCSTVKSIYETCSNNQQCDTNKGLICSSDRTCQCPQNTFYSNTSCVSYLSYGESCLVSASPTCNTELGLICDPLSSICMCPSLTYWSYAGCVSVSTYAEYCDQNSTCNTQVGLFCRLPKFNSTCDCPLPSKIYTCDCEQGQAWIVSTGLNSTSACVNQVTYSANCTSDSQCFQALDLTCINGVCDCDIPLWFWSQTSGKCLPCESQGYILIHFSTQWICTRLINSSLMAFSTSQSACSNVGWSLISPIVASDITIIAQAYPTYRVWIDIQTSLGNSNYTNILFPTNQSNWNMFISKSLTADYSTYVYALQIIGSYNQTMLFEGNTNVDTGHALCALY